MTVCLFTLTPRTRNPALSLSFRPCVQEPAGNIKVKFDDVKQEVDKQSVALVTAAVLAVSGHFEGIDLIQRERDSTERCVRLVSVCVRAHASFPDGLPCCGSGHRPKTAPNRLNRLSGSFI